jgi:hypothetical protein
MELGSIVSKSALNMAGPGFPAPSSSLSTLNTPELGDGNFLIFFFSPKNGGGAMDGAARVRRDASDARDTRGAACHSVDSTAT